MANHAPIPATRTAGTRNTGDKMTITKSLEVIVMVNSVRVIVHCAIGPSTARISWVHLVIIREVGVSSSQLKFVNNECHEID